MLTYEAFAVVSLTELRSLRDGRILDLDEPDPVPPGFIPELIEERIA